MDADIIAAAAENGSGTVRVKSEGYDMLQVDLGTLEPVEAEQGSTTAALVRGMCSEAARRGYQVRGFDACITSQVMQGSGLSSSAAFEVLIGAVVNGLFCNEELNATDLAIMGQTAENRFFGKPCGLMDQMASAWGGIIAIDFKDPAKPVVHPVDFDFAAAGHSLCMIDVGADHASLTHEYAAIPAEMKKISAHFGKDVLREVEEAEFFAAIPALRKEAGDRAVLRAIHIFQENRRVEELCRALEAGDFDAFFADGAPLRAILLDVPAKRDSYRQRSGAVGSFGPGSVRQHIGQAGGLPGTRRRFRRAPSRPLCPTICWRSSGRRWRPCSAPAAAM